MNKPPIHRRSPLISVLIFLILLALSLLLLALLQLDIGSYKQQLIKQLEQTLHQPIKLGDAGLSFQGGIALDFRNLQIGDNDNFRLYVPRLSTTLRLSDLLFGEIVIEQVLLDDPNLKLSLPLNLTRSTLELDRLGLKTLQIRKGTLTINHADHQNQTLHVDNFNLVLHGLGEGLVSQLATTATLIQADQNAELNLFLELTRQQQDQPWRQGQLSGNLSLNNLQHNLLTQQIPSELPKQFNLRLRVDGVPADKVLLEAAVNDSNNDSPLFSLAADWRSAPRDDSFHDLKLGLDGIPLTGELRLNRTGSEPLLTGRIGLSNTNLRPILARVKPLAQLSGQIEKLELTLKGPLHATADNPFSPLRSAYLKLSDIAYPFNIAKLSNTGMVIEMQNAQLSLKEGHGLFAQTPFSFTAGTGLLTQETPEIAIALNGTAELQTLLQEFPSPLLRRQKLTGTVPIDLLVQGPLNKLSSTLKIDMTSTELVIGKLLKKEQATPCTLELKGQLDPERLTLDQAQFNIAEAQIQLSGEWVRKNRRWLGSLQFAPLNLESLQPISPIFAFFKIQGETRGELKQDEKNGWTGQFKLSGGGAHLTQVLSDLNQVRGDLHLDKNGFTLEKVKAHLGRSPIEVSGELKNWRSPLLSLRVRGKELRAQDLIFTDRHMKLQGLDGRLLISAGGIAFDSIQVTVENRTTAIVEGQMRGWHNPHTYLEISSEEADILDVIRLFSGPSRIPQSSSTPHRATLEIKTRVKHGSLGSFTFENAAGTIHDRDNLFTLFPLNFNLGAGSATGRVEFNRLENNLLKISGQASNCDADHVYEMLFEKKGIFRGTLSGDFYIQGEGIGEEFWRSSQGGGHLQIKDGVMRELKGFAQIFSLLNVSQLFTFRLPDMDNEGLPFSQLKSSARITEGILHFDDFSIISPAINISAIGEIDSLRHTINSTIGIKPLRTVDIILSQVPLFGWVLTGKEEALITALFTLKGPIENPKVSAAPVSSVAQTALGIIGRTLGLPLRMLQKTSDFLTTPLRPGEETPPPAEDKTD